MVEKNFIKNRIESFGFAFKGLKDILATEHNARVHSIFTVVVLLLSWWLNIDHIQFALIVLVVALVWIAEAFNTVLEIIINIVSPVYSEAARRAKDIAAAAVLFAAIGAALTGLVILGPLLFAKINF
jgi:diacylglycerol kinase (ATP)